MKSILEHKKGQYQVSTLGAVAIAFVVAAIIFGIGAVILSDVGEEVGDGATNQYLCGINGSYAFNSTCKGSEGIDVLAGWLPTIALIIAAAIVIGVVIGSLAGGGGRRGR